jgi:Cys-tRNA(Pro)/Cys-tRNA(Cys) deacylase
MVKKDKVDKTLAMRVLEGQGIPFEIIQFPETIHDAVEVARYAGVPPENVYKTLVVEASEPEFKPMLMMIASNSTLDLKKAAKVIGAKKAQMARHIDAERLTGLKTGGISALAVLNKGFAIYIDAWAELLDFILVSAGQRGINVRLSPEHLIRVTGAQLAELTED